MEVPGVRCQVSEKAPVSGLNAQEVTMIEIEAIIF